MRHQAAVVALAFSPDGKMVLTGSFDNTARLWRVPNQEGTVDRIVLGVDVSTGEVLDPTGIVHGMEPATWYQRRHQLEELGGPPGAKVSHEAPLTPTLTPH